MTARPVTASGLLAACLLPGCGSGDPPPLPDPPAHVVVKPPETPPAPVPVAAELVWAGPGDGPGDGRPAWVVVGPDAPDAVFVVREDDVWAARVTFLGPDGENYRDGTR